MPVPSRQGVVSLSSGTLWNGIRLLHADANALSPGWGI